MKEITGQMVKVLNAGRYTRRSDTKFITDNIDRLINSERGYVNGIRALRDAANCPCRSSFSICETRASSSIRPVIRRADRTSASTHSTHSSPPPR